MLSHKLKHLCSHIVAVLSAFGFVSMVSEESEAVTYKPGVTFASYNVKENTTFQSTYNQMDPNVYCQLASNMDGYVSNENPTIRTGEYSGVGATFCVWKCPTNVQYSGSTITNEIEILITGQTTQVTDGTGYYTEVTYEPVYLTAGCTVLAPYICQVPENFKHMTADVVYGGGTNGVPTGVCKFTCAEGYHTADKNHYGTSNESQRSFNVRPADSEKTPYIETIYPSSTKQCVGDKYQITFDCGVNGELPSYEDEQTASIDVHYMSSFSIPEDMSCKKDGYKFQGWTTDKTFTEAGD